MLYYILEHIFKIVNLLQVIYIQILYDPQNIIIIIRFVIFVVFF